MKLFQLRRQMRERDNEKRDYRMGWKSEDGGGALPEVINGGL